jgi:hypothetical protein
MHSSLTSSLARVGGVANLLQSAAYLVAGAATLFIPLERVSRDTEGFTAFYAAHPAPFIVLALALIALGILGFTAVVPATAALLGEPRSGWVTFGKSVASLSLAVIVVYYTWFLSTISSFVAAYRMAPPHLKAAIAVNDPHVPANWVTWFIFGGMGLWVVVVGLTGRRGRTLPRGFGWACAIKTAGFWIALAGVLADRIVVAQVGVVLGVLVGGPLYHAWLGIEMLRVSRHPS